MSDIRISVVDRGPTATIRLVDGKMTLLLNKNQEKLFVYIARMLDRMHCPAYSEMMKELKVRSMNTIDFTIKKLTAVGLLETTVTDSGKSMHRGRRLTKFGRYVWEQYKKKVGSDFPTSSGD